MTDQWVVEMMQGALNIATFVIGSWLFPKAVGQWLAWKKTEKPIHLSAAVALGWAALCLLLGVLFKFVKGFVGQ